LITRFPIRHQPVEEQRGYRDGVDGDQNVDGHQNDGRVVAGRHLPNDEFGGSLIEKTTRSRTISSGVGLDLAIQTEQGCMMFKYFLY
jgi:hypothetical protein